ncbi:putative RNA methyltransferase At5g51130 [Sesbania bispinosa]|nr:putative RNA methyltransferase At5g51130 [Sesbania bispinosa]
MWLDWSSSLKAYLMLESLNLEFGGFPKGHEFYLDLSDRKFGEESREGRDSMGNYRSYYGYRIGQGVDEDPRLKVFRKEWFEGKKCLDIGCNNGLITIQIGCQRNMKHLLMEWLLMEIGHAPHCVVGVLFFHLRWIPSSFAFSKQPTSSGTLLDGGMYID